MEKLHWSVEQVAESSEREMLDALSATTIVKIKSKPPTAVHPPPSPGPHTVDTLRSSIRLKKQCMTSGTILEEDVDRLRMSTEASERMLQSELVALRAQLAQKQDEDTKKQTVRNLLLSVVPSCEDVEHLKILEEQITQIHGDIHHLTTTIGDSLFLDTP